MTHVYIDTNVFLDFYQSAEDGISVFNDILHRADRILLTQQTVEEFHRNRSGLLIRLAKTIESFANEPLHSAAVVRALPEFQQWVKTRDASKLAAKSIVNHLNSWIRDENKDPLLTSFNRLAGSAIPIATTDAVIAKAHERKALGRPPTSRDKYTIGDEVIWETILNGAKTDLVVVSRDKSYLSNRTFLQREYQTATGRSLVLVTSKLAEALEKVGAPSEAIKTAELSIPARPSSQASYAMQCLKCGGKLEEDGYEGSDGDDASWLMCVRCGDITNFG